MNNEEIENTQLWTILNQLPIGVMVFEIPDPEDDESIIIKMVNKAASSATGVDMTPFLGKPLLEIFPAVYDHENGLVNTYMKVLKTQEMLEIGDIEYDDEKISTTAFRVKCYPIDDHHVYITYQNITVLTAAKEAMEEKLSELKKVSGMLSDGQAKIAELEEELSNLKAELSE